MTYFFTTKEIQDAYTRASKPDKDQIKAYIKANTEPLPDGRRNCGLSGIFRLLEYRNLDNGSKHIGASYGFDGKGLSPNEARKLVGLLPIKGGDRDQPRNSRSDSGGFVKTSQSRTDLLNRRRSAQSAGKPIVQSKRPLPAKADVVKEPGSASSISRPTERTDSAKAAPLPRKVAPSFKPGNGNNTGTGATAPANPNPVPPQSLQSVEGCGVKVRHPLTSGGKQIRKKP